MIDISIEQLKTYSKELAETLNKLLKQLDSNSTNLNRTDLQEIIASPTNRLFVAKKGNKEIIGMLSLIIFRIPLAKKGLLEDFVVDEKYRGKGVGTKLVKTAVKQAKKEKVRYLDFTSRAERVAANRLYESLGFKKRNTNSYRIILRK